MRTFVAALLVFVALGAATAHETWLLPAHFAAKPATAVQLDLTSGEAFPTLDHAIKDDRVAKSGVRLGTTAIETAWRTGDKSLRATVMLPKKEGIATAWVSLKPRPIELTADKVGHYLDEIAASEAVRTEWAKVKATEPWREQYTKHAKTFIRVGDPGADRSWAEPVGVAFELVPKSDPTALTANGKFALTLMKDGKPLAGHAVGLIVEGKPDRVFRTTDKDGAAEFELPKAGAVLLFAVHLQRNKESGLWVSDFTTLTTSISGK